MSLLPLIFFLVVYLGGSAYLGDFYKIPMSVAFLVSSILAIAVSKGGLSKRITRFSAGAGDKNILLMVWIYIMAGAFAMSARQMGAVDATVALAMHVLPPSMVYVGLFLAAAFVSLAIGTSVGTVVALVPIAAGIAPEIGESVPFMAALVVGGAYFGDNLSFISDTTISATQTQGVRMADKFKMNVRIIWPAVLVMVVLCVVWGLGAPAYETSGEVDVWAVLPYVMVVLLSVLGVNVLLVLSIGILMTGVVGIASGKFDFWNYLASLNDGVIGMGELIIVALLAGGMLELIRANGGLRLIISVLQGHVHSKRGAEMTIASLVVLANLCTANNTVAIITVGRIARDVASRFGVDPRRSASLLDTFSCCVQGLIPYGVQMLLASKLAGCSPLEILPYLYYPMLIGLCALGSIFIGGKNKKKTQTDVA